LWPKKFVLLFLFVCFIVLPFTILRSAVNADNTNLMVNSIVPSDSSWHTDGYWTECPSYNVFYEPYDGHNGAPCYRIDQGSLKSSSSIQNCGADFLDIPISTGCQVVFTCWIKTGNGVGIDINCPWAGGYIGLDIYGEYGGVTAIDPAWLEFNNGWTLVTLRLIISSTYTVNSLWGNVAGHIYNENDSVVPTHCVPYFTVWGNEGHNTTGRAWFSNPVLIVNPPDYTSSSQSQKPTQATFHGAIGSSVSLWIVFVVIALLVVAVIFFVFVLKSPHFSLI
jgi:hypothetical protein